MERFRKREHRWRRIIARGIAPPAPRVSYRGIKLRDSISTGGPTFRTSEHRRPNMIIDFDSHLREGYFMDEVYKLDGPYERFRPVKLNDGRTHNTKFLHSLDPISPQGH